MEWGYIIYSNISGQNVFHQKSAKKLINDFLQCLINQYQLHKKNIACGKPVNKEHDRLIAESYDYTFSKVTLKFN